MEDKRKESLKVVCSKLNPVVTLPEASEWLGLKISSSRLYVERFTSWNTRIAVTAFHCHQPMFQPKVHKTISIGKRNENSEPQNLPQGAAYGRCATEGIKT